MSQEWPKITSAAPGAASDRNLPRRPRALRARPLLARIGRVLVFPALAAALCAAPVSAQQAGNASPAAPTPPTSSAFLSCNTSANFVVCSGTNPTTGDPTYFATNLNTGDTNTITQTRANPTTGACPTGMTLQADGVTCAAATQSRGSARPNLATPNTTPNLTCTTANGQYLCVGKNGKTGIITSSATDLTTGVTTTTLTEPPAGQNGACPAGYQRQPSGCVLHTASALPTAGAQSCSTSNNIRVCSSTDPTTGVVTNSATNLSTGQNNTTLNGHIDPKTGACPTGLTQNNPGVCSNQFAATAPTQLPPSCETSGFVKTCTSRDPETGIARTDRTDLTTGVTTTSRQGPANPQTGQCPAGMGEGAAPGQCVEVTSTPSPTCKTEGSEKTCTGDVAGVRQKTVTDLKTGVITTTTETPYANPKNRTCPSGETADPGGCVATTTVTTPVAPTTSCKVEGEQRSCETTDTDSKTVTKSVTNFQTGVTTTTIQRPYLNAQAKTCPALFTSRPSGCVFENQTNAGCATGAANAKCVSYDPKTGEVTETDRASNNGLVAKTVVTNVKTGASETCQIGSGQKTCSSLDPTSGTATTTVTDGKTGVVTTTVEQPYANPNNKTCPAGATAATGGCVTLTISTTPGAPKPACSVSGDQTICESRDPVTLTTLRTVTDGKTGITTSTVEQPYADPTKKSCPDGFVQAPGGCVGKTTTTAPGSQPTCHVVGGSLVCVTKNPQTGVTTTSTTNLKTGVTASTLTTHLDPKTGECPNGFTQQPGRGCVAAVSATTTPTPVSSTTPAPITASPVVTTKPTPAPTPTPTPTSPKPTPTPTPTPTSAKPTPTPTPTPTSAKPTPTPTPTNLDAAAKAKADAEAAAKAKAKADADAAKAKADAAAEAAAKAKAKADADAKARDEEAARKAAAEHNAKAEAEAKAKAEAAARAEAQARERAAEEARKAQAANAAQAEARARAEAQAREAAAAKARARPAQPQRPKCPPRKKCG
jgi:hypothetical protein